MKSEVIFKDKRLLEALEYIDEKYIDDVFNIIKEPDSSNGGYTKTSPLRHWRQYLAAAACILLLAMAMPFVGYVANVIGSIAAGTSGDTSGMTTDFESEATEPQEEILDFQYSDVKIIADDGTSINPVSVFSGDSWYKEEELVWTEKHGWQYIINAGKYKYEYFPHLTLENMISFTLPENVTLSSFKVYSVNWEETEHSFDKPYYLSDLPSGDYIIVGIEKEKIPFNKPHSPIGEYDYKLKESAIIFGLTVSNSIVAVNDLEYWKFIPELEEIDYDTMMAVKNAWSQSIREENYFSYYDKLIESGLSEKIAHELAQSAADAAAENAYIGLFNCDLFLNYGYLGRADQAVVIAKYTLKEREPISMEIVYDCIIEIYVYADGSIMSLQEAYEKELFTYNDMVKFKNRSEKYRRI